MDDAYVSAWTRLDGSCTDANDRTPDAVLPHVSDLHGQLTPSYHTYFESAVGPRLVFDDGVAIERAGGVPVLAAKLNELRASYGDRMLTLMSGDTFHGTAVTMFTTGEPLIEPVNNYLRPDVYVPGNWDFSPESDEDGAFRELMDALDAHVLANNCYDAETKERLFDDHAIVDVAGTSLGIVGMTNVYVDRMAPAFHEGKYRFGNHPALLEESAEAARDAGADIVVAVMEIGLPWTVQAAKDIDTVDVMFSAHTHEYTHDPIIVEDTGTVVVESGTGDALGRVDLRLVDGGLEFRHVLYCLVEGHEYTPEPDSAAKRTIEQIREPFIEGTIEGSGRSIEAVIGKTKTALHRQAFLESGWNTLFADAVQAHFGTDLAVTHGFRYGTAVPPGEVTLEQVYAAFPMTTPVTRGEAYGQQLRAHMEEFLVDNFTPYVYEQEDGRLRNFSSNVEVIIDPTAKRKRRLVDLRVDGEPVDPEETYAVATFRRPGDPDRELGNCGFPFEDVRVDEGTTPADVVVSYLEEHSPIDYETPSVIRVADDGGDVQNTPADGPYHYVQPGVDDDEYCETRLVPGANTFPDEGRNKYR